MRTLATLFCLTSALWAQTPGAAAPLPADVGRDLQAALGPAGADREPATAARLEALRGAATAAAKALGEQSLVAARLRAQVAADVPTDPAAIATALRSMRSLLTQVASDLRFQPMREAPVPEGWPAPAPVGDVVIKEYPSYRMAQAPMRAEGDMSAFWKLFQHIQSNDIPMTAPVQMDHAAGKGDELGERRAMAFLYEKGERGKPGVQGNVEVVDVPAATFVSIGARGYETQDTIDELTADLRRWLAAHAPRYELAGPMRVMGWNSPSVRGERRFYEVEFPVRLRRQA